MLPKELLIIFLVHFTLDANGHTNRKFFRNDYTFLEETQSFYKFFTIPKSYQDALTTCTRQGATLFFAENEHELNSVVKLWTAPGDYIFIGVSSLISKGVFTSIDGRPSRDVYNNWLPGEPNDKGGDENCIVMSRKGFMNDINCATKFPFICKKKETSLQWHEDCQTPYNNYVLNEGLGRCYKFFLTPMKWTEAFTVCNAEEAYLAVINSEEEMKFLINLTKEAPKHKIKGDYLSGVVLLGFHNRDKQGWTSIQGSTLDDSSYTQWGYVQPDVENKYLCGAMFYNGELTYDDCSQRSLFICEKELKSSFDMGAGNK